MRYNPLPSRLFKDNRKRLFDKIPDNSVVILNSNDLMPKNADQLMPFTQNSDLYYLSGIDQEETILVLIKEKESLEEFLFIRETNETIKIWEGEKLSKEQAKKQSGIHEVWWTKDFNSKINAIIPNLKNIYLNSNEHPRADVVVESRDARFKKLIKKQYPSHNFKKISSILYGLRSIKSDPEIEAIQIACDITNKGVDRVLSKLRPGVYEYEIEAEIIHEFLTNRATGFAYEPIIASGPNACILHYNTNNAICKDGDVVLMDFGAEYANYSSDLTRCFPVNGKFTKRQKEVYNSVLRVMNGAKKLLKPGVFLLDYEKDVGKLMEKELVDLGLISMKDIRNQKETPAYKKYYMHGTSHHLGLDVHDVSDPEKPLSKNMVLTCEPGIYIPEEGLGIRLENDILITETDNIDLMKGIPIEPEEIEQLINI